MTSKHLAFAVMATIWGLTWIAIKTGVDALPPFLFASTRLLAAGTFLLLLARLRGATLSMNGSLGRVVAAAILVNTVTYGTLFWGMQHIPSGLSSIVNLALIPVGLFTIGLAAGEETYSRRKVGAIALGVSGLVVLFLPKLSFEGDGLALFAMVALVVGTLAYCWGSILSRPLLRTLAPLALSGWLTLIGGTGLFALALLFEPIDATTLSAFLELPVVGSWLFLVLGGSVIAFTLYLRLLRDWGPTRAGLYAFVSPIIAVVLGVFVFDEPFGAYEIVGSTIMLAAAALAMQRDTE
ncbi:MAG: DMT family transporter [Acidobacteriota bacterium]|nr:MAG: DMT family transporter [Acidobacteriota bacterium]